jgi:hypothetical protein
MNITILNGNPDQANTMFDRYIDLYRVQLFKIGHYTRFFTLREMAPGDMRYITNGLHETDLLVFASPMQQGSLSLPTRLIQEQLKQMVPKEISMSERLLPANPGKGLPMFGFILQIENETSEQELLLNRLSQERIAANLHTLLGFFVTTETGVADGVCKTLKGCNYQRFVENTCNDFLSKAGTVC